MVLVWYVTLILCIVLIFKDKFTTKKDSFEYLIEQHNPKNRLKSYQEIFKDIENDYDIENFTANLFLKWIQERLTIYNEKDKVFNGVILRLLFEQYNLNFKNMSDDSKISLIYKIVKILAELDEDIYSIDCEIKNVFKTNLFFLSVYHYFLQNKNENSCFESLYNEEFMKNFIMFLKTKNIQLITE